MKIGELSQLIGSITGLLGAATPIILEILRKKNKKRKSKTLRKEHGAFTALRFIILPLSGAVILFFLGYKGTGIIYASNAPTISLSEAVVDDNGVQINLDGAPFIIRVKGNVSKAKKHFTYLIVNDFNANWVQPKGSLGKGTNSDFSGYCYLGQQDTISPLSNYEVFAVVTNREYREYEHLDNNTILASSNRIQLHRTR